MSVFMQIMAIPSKYMKTGKVPHEEAISLLIDAGERVYTYEFMEKIGVLKE